MALFTVVLFLGAMAVDQGLALGTRRVVQKDADAASRAGAIACISALSGGDPCTDGAIWPAANGVATANLAKSEDVTAQAASTCPLPPPTDAMNDAPSAQVTVGRPSASLFSKAFGIDGFWAKATSTTCVGTASRIKPGTIAPIPLWLSPAQAGCNGNNGDSGCGNCGNEGDNGNGENNGCGPCGNSNNNGPAEPNCNNCGAGSNSETFAGRECVIFSTEHLSSSGTFYESSGTCGPKSSSLIANAIQISLTTFDCKTADSNSTAGEDQVQDYFGNSSWKDGILDAFRSRMPGNEPCGPTTNVRSGLRSVVAALGGAQADPAGAGGNDPSSTVYQQRACTSPRLALVMLVSGSGGTKTIQGFAAVYIEGCTPSDDNNGPGSLNECGTSDRGSNDGGPSCGHNCSTDTRVWGIVLRVYLAGSGVQDIGGIGHDAIGGAAALAIQTVNDPKSN